MDDLEFSGKEMDITLQELETINKWLGGNNITLNGVENILKHNPNPGGKIKIADLGCGGGDMLKLLANWGRKNKLNLELTGIDANEYIIHYARENCKNYPEAQFEVLNIFDEAFEKHVYDIICCTLFTHHFSNEELVQIFQKFYRQARMGVTINDLHRHWLAYHSIKWLTYLFSHSPMVKNDAPVSVLRAFSKKDIKEILRNAQITDYKLKWRWAFRWELVIYKDEELIVNN
ncbi:methyltransferase domain-containing protein [Cytophagales bacterium RKSG123]|nr:methyltransferase domain-containing protein [Xanthovirga aplysinae]